MVYECQMCGADFKRTGKKIPKFCSLACRNKSYKRIKTFSCEWCKKEFSGTKRELTGKKRFCSQSCTNERKRVAYRGKKVKYITVGCNYCKKGFTRMPSKMNEKNYCDKSCRGKAVWKEKNLSEKMVWKPCHGIVGDKRRWFRSMWELVFAKDFLSERGFTWQYEPTTFNLSDGSTYTPDFYIEDDDLWVEVKGYEREVSIKRFLKFREEYAETAILANEYVLKSVYGLNLEHKYLKSLCVEGGQASQ